MSSSKSAKVIRQYRFLEGELPGTATAAQMAAMSASVATESEGPSISVTIETLLQQANAQAELMLLDAQAQIETLRQEALAEARKRGFEAGRQEGLAAAQAASEEQLASVRNILDAITEQRTQILVKAEADLVDLAIAIARKVIGDAAAEKAEVIVSMAQQAVRVLGQTDNIQVHLHPSDTERITAHWQASESRPDWAIVPDERVAPGGCIVTSGASSVDARPETQLELIQRAFLSGDQ